MGISHNLVASIVIALIALSSCSKRVITSTSEVKDSVRVEYVPRDVPVYIPGDTVTVTDWIECDSVTNKPKPITIKKKAGRTTLNLKVKSTGQLSASSSCDSLTQIITVLDKEVFRLRHEKVVKTEPIYKTRKIDKICRWFSGVVLLLIIIYIILRVKKLLWF